MAYDSEKIAVVMTDEEFAKMFFVNKDKPAPVFTAVKTQETFQVGNLYNYSNYRGNDGRVHKFETYVIKKGESGDRRVLVELVTVDNKTFTGTIQFMQYNHSLVFKDK